MKPWTEQKLGCPPLQIFAAIRSCVRGGKFDSKAWDHNHPGREKGRSNKQIKIVGAWLLDRRNITMKEAWDAVLEAVLGEEGARETC